MENEYQCPLLRLHELQNEQQICVRGLHIKCFVRCYVPFFASASASDILERYLVPSLKFRWQQCHSMFQRNTSINEARSDLINALCDCVLSQMCSMHFSIEGYVVPLSVIYPFSPGSQSNENSQVEFRKQLHRRFLQKENRPVFLSSLSLEHKPTTLKTEHPINVHDHLPQKSASDASI